MRSPTIERYGREIPVEGKIENAQLQDDNKPYSASDRNLSVYLARSDRRAYSVGNNAGSWEHVPRSGPFRSLGGHGWLAKLGPVRPSWRQARTTSDDPLGPGKIQGRAAPVWSERNLESFQGP